MSKSDAERFREEFLAGLQPGMPIMSQAAIDAQNQDLKGPGKFSTCIAFAAGKVNAALEKKGTKKRFLGPNAYKEANAAAKITAAAELPPGSWKDAKTATAPPKPGDMLIITFAEPTPIGDGEKRVTAQPGWFAHTNILRAIGPVDPNDAELAKAKVDSPPDQTWYTIDGGSTVTTDGVSFYNRSNQRLDTKYGRRFIKGWYDVAAMAGYADPPPPGDDDADDSSEPVGLAPRGAPTESDDGAVAVLGLLGAVMLAGGVYWYTLGKPGGVNAFTSADATALARAWNDELLRHEYLGHVGHWSNERGLEDDPHGVLDDLRHELEVRAADGDLSARDLSNHLVRGLLPPGRLFALASAHQDVTVNIEPRDDGRDFEFKTKYERLLTESGFDVTGGGTAFGQGGVTGTDVDVRCQGVCDEGRLREIAERAGVVVAADGIRPWRV